MWDEKDILVCVHIRNILRARWCFQNVKVPSSPYKRRRGGTCKFIHYYWKLVPLVGDSLSLTASLLLLNVLAVSPLSRVRGSCPFFRIPQQGARLRQSGLGSCLLSRLFLVFGDLFFRIPPTRSPARVRGSRLFFGYPRQGARLRQSGLGSASELGR
jgi:hypothetical protein